MAAFNYNCRVELEQRLDSPQSQKYLLPGPSQEKYAKTSVNHDNDVYNNLYYYNSNPQIPFELYYVPKNSHLEETKTFQQLVSQGINRGDVRQGNDIREV